MREKQKRPQHRDSIRAIGPYRQSYTPSTPYRPYTSTHRRRHIDSLSPPPIPEFPEITPRLHIPAGFQWISDEIDVWVQKWKHTLEEGRWISVDVTKVIYMFAYMCVWIGYVRFGWAILCINFMLSL